MNYEVRALLQMRPVYYWTMWLNWLQHNRSHLPGLHTHTYYCYISQLSQVQWFRQVHMWTRWGVLSVFPTLKPVYHDCIIQRPSICHCSHAGSESISVSKR